MCVCALHINRRLLQACKKYAYKAFNSVHFILGKSYYTDNSI